MYTLEETIYRPPLEEHSVLLEISIGCSHGKCTFCRYSDGQTPLQLVSTEVIAENLEEMASEGVTGERMFLTGGNVFAFKARYLLDLFAFIRQYLPSIRQFCMYARADDVLHKTEEQLKELKEAGLDTLYVGVESGNDEILLHCRKGETARQIIDALHILDRFGIRYGLSSILGLGGKKYTKENALDTAALYNAVSPASIRVMTLTPMVNTPLAEEVANGSFRLLSVRESIEEELLLLENLNLNTRCRFVANHVSNSSAVCGWLPEEKNAMLKVLRESLSGTENEASGKAQKLW